MRLALIGALSVALLACEPQPREVECVCRCEAGGTPAGQSETVEATPVESEAGEAPTRRSRGSAARARGRIPEEPGTGSPVDLSDGDRESMTSAFVAFLEDARERELDAMKAHTTERLGRALERHLPRYEERLYRGLRPTFERLGAEVELRETRELGRGNVEGRFRFADGHEHRAVFFREDDRWLLNRL